MARAVTNGTPSQDRPPVALRTIRASVAGRSSLLPRVRDPHGEPARGRLVGRVPPPKPVLGSFVLPSLEFGQPGIDHDQCLSEEEAGPPESAFVV
jgi:hypothetical protein